MTLPLGLMARLPLLTPRLVITPFTEAHLPPLAAMLADPVVMRAFPRVMTTDESRSWLRRTIERYALHGTGLAAVLSRDAPASSFLGDCGVQIRHFGGRTHLELGYHFTRGAWGRGLATEAAIAWRDLVFAHTDASELVALIRPENGPSQAVARRVGLSPSGAVLHAGLVHDVWRRPRQSPATRLLQ